MSLKRMRVEVYRELLHVSDGRGEEILGDWRWRRIKKGRITHASTEGYTKFSACMENLKPLYFGLMALLKKNQKSEKIFILDKYKGSQKEQWWRAEMMGGSP